MNEIDKSIVTEMLQATVREQLHMESNVHIIFKNRTQMKIFLQQMRAMYGSEFMFSSVKISHEFTALAVPRILSFDTDFKVLLMQSFWEPNLEEE